MVSLEIRNGNIFDLAEMQQLFVNTIRHVCRQHYSEEQIKAWISSVENTSRWYQILNDQYVLVAHCNQQLVGFTSLDKFHNIDLLYVHKDYQRKGIAQELLNLILEEAKTKNQAMLTSDVSITAKPFFERNKFTVVKEQKVIRNGVVLSNFNIIRLLS